MNSQRHLFSTGRALDKSLERLSSGLRINSGADDASGLAMSEKMAAQNAGLLTANQNAQDGQALYKIAEGALNQVNSMLTRMEELAVRATNGTLTDSDRTAIMDEVGELKDQINQITSTTEYNTLKVLNGSMAVETHITEGVGNLNQGSIRIIDKPGTLKTGTYDFEITAVATSAEFWDNIASQDQTTSGLININGIDISISAGESLSAVAAKINDVNDQTGVIAAVHGGGSNMNLLSGVLDDDAKNIDPTMAAAGTPIIGYTTLGSDAQITLSGDNQVLLDMGFNYGGTTTTNGTDVTGTIDGVDMVGKGSVLESTQHGSGTYGLKIDTDLYNGGNGAYIYNGTFQHDISRSQNGDTATIDIDISNRLRLQTGANTNQSIYNGIQNISTSQLGIGGSSKYGSLDDIDLTTTDNANISLKVVQKAIEDVTAVRSKIGATMNRLEYTIKTLSIQHENLTAAQSRIQDADISLEMGEFTKQQILLQSGTAMLAQANSKPQTILSLLR
jgi:flagellin